MCGLAGIVPVRNGKKGDANVDLSAFKEWARIIKSRDLAACRDAGLELEPHYLGGDGPLANAAAATRALKGEAPFYALFNDRNARESLAKVAARLADFIGTESAAQAEQMGRMDPTEVDVTSRRLELLKDISWCLRSEIDENVGKVRDLLHRSGAPEGVFHIFRRVNAVLNSIDRLEVRGRDSAGISLMFLLDGEVFSDLQDTLDKANFMDAFRERTGAKVLVNRGVGVRASRDENGSERVALTFVYKVAAEIGSLGDNVAFLRDQIKNDPILQAAVNFSYRHFTVLSHTRWASVGAIGEPNCHPVDSRTGDSADGGIYHVCLNGDIDNYLSIKERMEKAGRVIPPEVSTDTKVIPMLVEHHVREGADVAEAFRRAVNEFEGSHAIAMHTDLAPGRMFLAQRGSGQAIFVGLADGHYMAASEVYGFIEETDAYIKLDGERRNEEGSRGQIVILDQESAGGLSGITSTHYDGAPVTLTDADRKKTAITSRDIDRQEFPHYFLKEISEAPVSVERTLQNRWRLLDGARDTYAVTLDESTVPESLRTALTEDRIRRVFFVGQGTAGVAAQACADILDVYMDDPRLQIDSLKASELSGFKLHDSDTGMEDTLVVAISQSGTTTDTNRTVDMVRERGAHTLAIVNRRDSDITFKVDGVMYTSSGRDIEMSVASTKAFYSQIVAGALLSLFLAHVRGRRNDAFVTGEVQQLLALPGCMRRVLAMRDRIEQSARRTAVTRTYWAAVGSGPNKTSADEIRIKLSELCYKTISSDYVEDKKHIDLSSEPLIIVCAAGTRATVIGDIIKDTAIFKAHKAVPLVIADEGETRFDPYADDVFHVPPVREHLSPILNTLVGHLWGYYAALAINEGSRFLFTFRESVQNSIDASARDGLDVYELLLEKTFREKMAQFYTAFRKRRMENGLPASIGLAAVSDLTLLLKYLAGRLPVTDYELDFGQKGTARNMLTALLECLGEAINNMARPVDAIKHQAKTVTVGTSRITEKLEGVLFDHLRGHEFKISQLTTTNVIVLKNLQKVISGVQGTTLYQIHGLNLLGEPTDDTTIEMIHREGTSTSIPSRVDKDNRLKGTKRTIVQAGNVYIGKGRKDDRSILVIPLLSDAVSAANTISHLVLLHIAFQDAILLENKVKALGGKYDKIKNIVQENGLPWDDRHLDRIETAELFGLSAEKVAEAMVGLLK